MPRGTIDHRARCTCTAHNDRLAVERNRPGISARSHRDDAHLTRGGGVDGRLDVRVLTGHGDSLAFVGRAVVVDVATGSASDIARVGAQVAVAVSAGSLGYLATIDATVLVTVDGGATDGEIAAVDDAVGVAVKRRRCCKFTCIRHAVQIAILRRAARDVAAVGHGVQVAVGSCAVVSLSDIEAVVAVAIAGLRLDAHVLQAELRERRVLAFRGVDAGGAGH